MSQTQSQELTQSGICRITVSIIVQCLWEKCPQSWIRLDQREGEIFPQSGGGYSSSHRRWPRKDWAQSRMWVRVYRRRPISSEGADCWRCPVWDKEEEEEGGDHRGPGLDTTMDNLKGFLWSGERTSVTLEWQGHDPSLQHNTTYIVTYIQRIIKQTDLLKY